MLYKERTPKTNLRALHHYDEGLFVLWRCYLLSFHLMCFISAIFCVKNNINLYNNKKSATFAALLKNETLNIDINMDTLLKNLGAILVLLGVVCLAIYFFGVQVNGLLVAALVLQVGGLFAHVILNKRYQ